VSALFSLFKSRKKQAAAHGEKYLLQDMANDAGVTKAQVSRWFNGEVSPNWRLSTVYDIAEALDGEVRIEIKDRRTGEVHTSHGVEQPVAPVSASGLGQLYIVRLPSAYPPRRAAETWGALVAIPHDPPRVEKPVYNFGGSRALTLR
jgi:transcriptional regulator with XRE-family HTH domain